MMNEKTKNIRKILSDLFRMLAMKFPFIMSLILKLRIVATKLIETCGVSTDGTLYINPDWFVELSENERIFVILHEALHLALGHPWRAKNKKYREIYNIAADVVINEILREYFEFDKVPEHAITKETLYEALDVFVFDDDTAETAYKKILDECECEIELKIVLAKIFIAPYDLLRGADFPGILIREPEDYKYYAPEEYWDMVRQQMGASRRIPERLRRMLMPAESKVNWRLVLRQAVVGAFRNMKILDWSRPSRKHPDLPGLKTIYIPKIVVLMDVSFSISKKILNQFYSEILAIARAFNSKVKVVLWSDEVLGVVELSHKNFPRKIVYGGGTVIAPALEKALEITRKGDIVVILSDWHISDLDEQETMRLIKKLLSSRFVVSLSVSSPYMFGHKRIFIETEP